MSQTHISHETKPTICVLNFCKNSYHPGNNDCMFGMFSDNPSLIFIQYLFDGKVHSVDCTPHANSQSSEDAPYIRTKDSTQSWLQEACNKKPPKSAYH